MIPTAIEWTRHGKKNNKLTISVDGHVVLEKFAAKAQIDSKLIRLWKRKGLLWKRNLRVEEIPGDIMVI